jgi:hypothetical protein
MIKNKIPMEEALTTQHVRDLRSLRGKSIA